MARLLPDELDAVRALHQNRAELVTLERLERELPDDFTVFHGVHWARIDDGAAAYGEIDFLVVNRYGRVLAIEQKNGPVAVEGGELVKHYASGPRALRAQVTRNIDALQRAWGLQYPDRQLDIEPLFYCPDERLAGRLPAAIGPERVIDAADAPRLAARILEWFDRRPLPATPANARKRAADPLAVHAFLSERVEVVPDIGALSERLGGISTRLASGLGTWAGRLRLAPHRLRVIGTAGSGKTQLALQELRDAHRHGRSALYLCFNRPLADAMRRHAPDPVSCVTFHELAAKLAEVAGETIDWAAPGVFDRLAQGLIDRVGRDASLRGWVDVLVVDEGQDFEPAWAEAVLALAAPGGRVTWLEDPMQNLYGREPVRLPGWPVLRSPANCRSPRIVTTLIEALDLVDEPLEAASGFHGFEPLLRSYTDDAPAQTAAMVAELRALGHAPSRIAVLSFHGAQRSELLRAERIDGLRVRRQLGYDEDGNTVWSDGELLVDTVFRFKGQSADAVVLTEVDFAEWDERARRRLFVGLTRARMRVAIVASRAATALLTERLGA